MLHAPDTATGHVYISQDSGDGTLCHCLGHYPKGVQVDDAGVA